MKKGEFYILCQPEKVILSVVLVDSSFPLSEEVHDKLGELQKVSDIMFIFSDASNINALSFGSLYQACGYIEAEQGELSETLVRTFEYDKEIFGTHRLIMFTQTSDMTGISGDKLQEIAASDLVKPIFKTRRLKSVEFFEIYNKKYPGKHKTWSIFPISTADDEEEGTAENLYSTYTTDSKELLFRPLSIGKIIKFWEEDEGEGYVCSFTNPDLRYFLASVSKKLRLSCLEINADDYGKTERK